MKRLKFINCDKKISTTEIESVENKYNFKYPEEIKKLWCEQEIQIAEFKEKRKLELSRQPRSV